jgi:hypothetical protein
VAKVVECVPQLEALSLITSMPKKKKKNQKKKKRVYLFLSSISLCDIHFEALLLGVYIFKIVISF